MAIIEVLEHFSNKIHRIFTSLNSYEQWFIVCGATN